MNRPILTALLCTVGLAATTTAWALSATELAATRSRAEQGNASAQMLLGLAYLHGDAGAEGAPGTGIHWLEQAALQGNAYAAHRLGDQYASGQAVPQNWPLAMDWYRRAARRNDAEAQFKLARIYLEGQGGPANPERAGFWLAKAAAAGNAEAEVLLTRLEPGESAAASPVSRAWRDLMRAVPAVATSDRALSIQALQQLAGDGDADAQYRLAQRYRLGQGGTPRDMTAARLWLTRAAEQGHGDAMRVLADLYAQGSDSMAADARTADYWNQQAKAAVR